MIPFITGTLTGLTAMVPLAVYLWWCRALADVDSRITRCLLKSARYEIASLTPLAEVGRKRLAALERAKAKGK